MVKARSCPEADAVATGTAGSWHQLGRQRASFAVSRTFLRSILANALFERQRVDQLFSRRRNRRHDGLRGAAGKSTQQENGND